MLLKIALTTLGIITLRLGKDTRIENTNLQVVIIV